MTALLEAKQKIKNFYGRYEAYFLPVVKFAIALLFFTWINSSMGYMTQLNNIFLVLILALICCILPYSATVYVGLFMMVLHSYALCIEAAGFMLVLILVMLIFLLRFSGGQNIVLALAPLSFGLSVPALLPIGGGLLGNALAAIPAGCGAVLFYFIRFLKIQSSALMDTETEVVTKLQLMADGLVRNWGMWITVVAFVLVLLMVYVIRTRAVDYAWRVAVVAGGVIYVLVMLVGSMYLDATVSMPALIVCTAVSMILGLLIEFFAFGGDYSRTERLEYEDDDYVYYVKAVPKAAVTSLERSIKKINAQPAREQHAAAGTRSAHTKPRADGAETAKKNRPAPAPVPRQPKVVQEPERDVDFEKKLEESLRDL